MRGFAEAASESLHFTTGCPYVLYTAYFFASTAANRSLSLPKVPKSAVGCALAFVNVLPAKSSWFESWRLVLVRPPYPSGSPRRNSRIPKIRPDLFFDAVTIYVDSKSLLHPSLPLAVLVDRTLTQCNASFAAFVNHQRPSSALDEFAKVVEISTWREATREPEALQRRNRKIKRGGPASRV